MEVIETSAVGLKREFRVVVPAQTIEAQVESQLDELRLQVRMPGFRPGRVPIHLIRKSHGPMVRGKVLEQTVSDVTRQTLEEREIRPAMQPSIEVDKFDAESGLEYRISLEMLPTIEPASLEGVTIERFVIPVEPSEVDDALGAIAREQRKFEAVEGRAAELGDSVVIDFLGSIDGVPFDGGAATDAELELGAGRFIPGFEEQLVGAMAGEERTLTVTLPEDYGADQLAGKAASFAVTVKAVKAAEPVPVDDALAVSLGLENLEKLRESVEAQLARRHEPTVRMGMKRQILDALADRHDFPVPEGLVDIELDSIVRQALASEDKHLPPAGSDEPVDAELAEAADKARVEYRPIAERRVRLGLLLAEIGRIHTIEVGNEEVTRAIMQRARQFPGQERQVFEFYRSNPEFLAQIRAPLLEDKVIDHLVAQVTVTDRSGTIEELQAAIEDDGTTEGAEQPT